MWTDASARFYQQTLVNMTSKLQPSTSQDAMPDGPQTGPSVGGQTATPAGFETASPASGPTAMPSAQSTEPLSERDARILQAASRLFAQRGFVKCDVQEIADELAIGKGTIYRAFGTKEELFFATVDYGMRELSKRLSIKSADKCNKRQALEAWLITFFQFFAEHAELVELLMQERSEFRDRQSHSYVRHWLSNVPSWKAHIEEGMAMGRIRPMDADKLIDTLSAMCYGTIFISFFSNKKINSEETAKFLSDVLHLGVFTEKERVACNDGDYK
jgi:AcrR family transcriptional regulator